MKEFRAMLDNVLINEPLDRKDEELKNLEAAISDCLQHRNLIVVCNDRTGDKINKSTQIFSSIEQCYTPYYKNFIQMYSYIDTYLNQYTFSILEYGVNKDDQLDIAILMALFRADMDKPFARARLLHLSTVWNRFDLMRGIIFPDSCDAVPRIGVIPKWLADFKWSDDQKQLSLKDFEDLMRFVLSNDRDDLLREFIVREDIVKSWLSIKTLRELYSQIRKDSPFGRLLFEERERQLLKYKAYLKSDEDKATQKAALLELERLYPAASPDFESVLRSVR